MNLPEICIRRPVLAIVLNSVLIVLGFLGYQQVKMEFMPSVFKPVLTIITNVPGASSDFVEQNVTNPLENNLKQVGNVSFETSESTSDKSKIKLYFGTISQDQFLTVQSQVQQAISQTKLPTNAKNPLIRTRDGSSPLFILGVTDKNIGPYELGMYVTNNIVNPISQMSGVGAVDQYGAQPQLQIELNPKQMALKDVSIDDIKNAISSSNTSISAGNIINKDQQITLNLNSKLTNLDNFKNIIIKKTGRHLIYLKDVSKLGITDQNPGGSLIKINNSNGQYVIISQTDTANPLILGEMLRKKLKEIQKQMPTGMKIVKLQDTAEAIKVANDEVFHTIVEAVVAVTIITILFIGSWRLSLIPLVTIPVCLIATFLIIWMVGFTLNIFSMLALVVAVGLVVDDAIVVLENAQVYSKKGISPIDSTIQSMNKIIFPVIGMTIVIAAIYVPIFFMKPHKETVYLQQFAFSLSGAVLFSGFVALTLSPMMCSRLIRPDNRSQLEKLIEKFFIKVSSLYIKSLKIFLNNIWLPVLIVMLFFFIGYLYFQKMSSTDLPPEYDGTISVTMRTPDSSSVEKTRTLTAPLIKELRKFKEVQAIGSITSKKLAGNSSVSNTIVTNLKSEQALQELSEKMMQALNKIKTPDVKISATPNNFNSHGGNNAANQNEFDFYVTGYASPKELNQATNNLVNALKQTGMFLDIENNSKFNQQQYDLTIQNNKLIRLGLTREQVNDAINTYLGTYSFPTDFDFLGQSLPLVMGLPAKKIKDLSVLQTIFLKNKTGNFISLDRVVTPNFIATQQSITHINNTPAGEIGAIPKTNISKGKLIKIITATGKQSLPYNLKVAFNTKTQSVTQAKQSSKIIVIASIIFIYLILGALFESFIDPLIILTTIPMCVISSMIALYYVDGSFNTYTIIGFITLVGLISKHGILITKFANDLKNDNVNTENAIIQACQTRLRPILMTTATMIIGLIPLLYASGVSKNSHLELGVVLIVGLIFGTLFSLYIVPSSYKILSKYKKA